MTVLIYETGNEELSGQFIAEIGDGKKKSIMKYDLSKQDSTYDGYYTDKAVVFLHPAPMTFKFNIEYNIPGDVGEMVAFLADNGWYKK